MYSKNIIQVILRLVYLVALWVLPSSLYAQANDLKVELASTKAAFKANDAVRVQFSVTNVGSKTVHLLKWGTPLEEGFTKSNFAVALNNTPIQYIGRMVKRGAPTATDYVEIRPGKTVSAVVDLADGYALSTAGGYTVQYLNQTLVVKQNPAAGKLKNSEAIRVSTPIRLNLSEPRPDRQGYQAKQPATYTNCSSSRRSQIESALTQAENLALVAKNDLNNTPASQRSNVPRYRTWFGSFSNTRYALVDTSFSKIYNVLANQSMRFDCGCTQDYYAYVQANDPYKVYFCAAFWGAPLTGSDSKAGTIIHETSHFTIVVGTQDHAYGHSAAKALAISSPTQALNNADNFEYFAENTPALAMGTLDKIHLPHIPLLLLEM